MSPAPGQWSRRHLLYPAAAALFVSNLVLALSGPMGSSPLVFGPAFAISFGCMLLCHGLLAGERHAGRTLATIVLYGLGIRLAFLFLFPAGNDIYRYIWEGHVQLLGHNPYLLAPAGAAHLAEGHLAGILAGVNHPDLTAAYPPLTQLLFRLVALVSPTVPAFKLLMGLADCATLACLALWVQRRKLPARNLLFYAANPLVLVSLSGEAHVDALMVLALAAGLCLFAMKRPGAAFLALGAAVAFKYLAVVLLPFFVTRHNRRYLVWALVPALSALPFLGAGPAMFSSLSHFGTVLHYNDAITALLRLAGFSSQAAVMFAVAFFGLMALGIFLAEQHPERSAFLVAGALLLCLPTLHPWYLCLITPFLVRYPSPAWLALHLLVLATLPVLATEQATGVFQEIHWLKLVEYLPFYLLLLAGWIRGARSVTEHRHPPAGSLAVVVPTLNEAGTIRECLASIAGQDAVSAAVVVADGGSSDGTPGLAASLGAKVVNAPRGRGIQIARGVESCAADAVLVLHADCVLAPGVAASILERLNADPHLAGGAVGMTFTSRGFGPWLIGCLNSLRVRLTGISFGDQAQFFRMAALEQAGGFPELRLMEDVELALRLKCVGRLAFFGQGVRVSYRSWNRRGLGRGMGLVLGLFFRFLLERRLGLVSDDAAEYHARYYGTSS